MVDQEKTGPTDARSSGGADRLDGVEAYIRREVHLLEQVHPGGLGPQVISVGISGDAQLVVAGASPADGGIAQAVGRPPSAPMAAAAVSAPSFRCRAGLVGSWFQVSPSAPLPGLVSP